MVREPDNSAPSGTPKRHFRHFSHIMVRKTRAKSRKRHFRHLFLQLSFLDFDPHRTRNRKSEKSQSPIPDLKSIGSQTPFTPPLHPLLCGNVEAGESRWSGNACGGRNFVRASAEESRFHRASHGERRFCLWKSFSRNTRRECVCIKTCQARLAAAELRIQQIERDAAGRVSARPIDITQNHPQL